MKSTKSILILLSLFLIFSCGEKVREEITERYNDGQKKVLVKYKGEGSNEVVIVRISYFENGETSKWTNYYRNGQIEVEENYKDGKVDGKQTSYFENGQIKEEVNFKDGILNGNITQYYQNGQLESEVNFKDNKKNGKLIHYSETGEITLEGNFIMGDGKLIGYRNGKIISETNILNGEIVDTKRY